MYHILQSERLFKFAYTLRTSKRYFAGYSLLGPKSLNEIVKLDILDKEPTEKIKAIWSEYHMSKLDALSGSLKAEEFSKFRSNMTKCPTFVYPCFKSKESYYVLISQFQTNFLAVTYLEGKEVPVNK